MGICLAVVCPRIVRKESLAAIPAEIPAPCGPGLVRMEKFGISLVSWGWGESLGWEGNGDNCSVRTEKGTFRFWCLFFFRGILVAAAALPTSHAAGCFPQC